MTSVTGAGARREPSTLVTKGAPESVLARCRRGTGLERRRRWTRNSRPGNRVVAVATGDVDDRTAPNAGRRAGAATGRTAGLPRPAQADAAAGAGPAGRSGHRRQGRHGRQRRRRSEGLPGLGLPADGALSGPRSTGSTTPNWPRRSPHTTVFARVSPEHKARIVRVQRLTGGGVAFLGDGVNDALALHAADVGISVDRPPTWPRTPPT